MLMRDYDITSVAHRWWDNFFRCFIYEDELEKMSKEVTNQMTKMITRAEEEKILRLEDITFLQRLVEGQIRYNKGRQY